MIIKLVMVMVVAVAVVMNMMMIMMINFCYYNHEEVSSMDKGHQYIELN
jgi:hypothetical protein